MNPALIALALIGVVGCALATIAAATLSRHKKLGSGQPVIIGATGLVNTRLNPEGTVLLNGELWRARSQDSIVIVENRRVIVADVLGHLLLVAPLS